MHVIIAMNLPKLECLSRTSYFDRHFHQFYGQTENLLGAIDRFLSPVILSLIQAVIKVYTNIMLANCFIRQFFGNLDRKFRQAIKSTPLICLILHTRLMTEVASTGYGILKMCLHKPSCATIFPPQSISTSFTTRPGNIEKGVVQTLGGIKSLSRRVYLLHGHSLRCS